MIVWRNSPAQQLQEYKLCTVTYGTKAAPYLAMRTIQQLVKDDGKTFPLAAEMLTKQLYMDDLLGGHNDIELAKEAQRQILNILQGGGFNLRKWTSNDQRLLENLTPEQLSTNMYDFRHAETNKTLGLQWNPCTDSFTFKRPKIETNADKQITKRTFLSDISKIFDPLEWLSPITVKGKMLFQEVWAAGIGWDDPVPSNIQTEWMKYTQEIKHINNITLPRHIGPTNQRIELHGYCDASEKAYAAVIYCKTKEANGTTTTRLVAAKTKLAPLKKQLSIPRLELCGALLLANLIEKVREALQGLDMDIIVRTDSMVVLGWLQGETSRWKSFVASRVKKIHNIIPAKHWGYIKSEENPADIASRGIMPSQLPTSDLWWRGPQNMEIDNEQQKPSVPTPILEVKPKQTCVTQTQESTFVNKLLQKHSSLNRVTHIISWIKRFITNIRTSTRHVPNSSPTMHLTTTEIDDAYKNIVKTIQSQSYSEDIKLLQTKNKLRNKSTLLNLNPFLDRDNILRVGGRLNNSLLNPNRRHPIILPKNNRLIELLIEQAHQTTLHGGARLTLAHLRDNYWVIGGQNTVNKEIRKCVKCQRYNKIGSNQLMADLPEPRVTPSRPFTHCGVDFTGQVEVKANKGRGIRTTKGYVCVFICLATKAVHLELVSDLSSPSFLAAFRRMSGRRGMPKHMYSDQGTNFIGAAKTLRKEFEEALTYYKNKDVLNQLTDLGVEWHFNAPSWPSAGGLWESAVRSMKYHLKRVIGEQKLFYEEFSTLLTQIEACLNSRPLMTLTEDIDDLEYLSPGHFLIGEPILSSPLQSKIVTGDIRLRWKQNEKMQVDFWKKWSTEYLSILQARPKWTLIRKNIAMDDIVVIKDELLPPAQWLLGRVLQTHPGKDGLVRVVTLKTRNGILQRPITKLAILPVHIKNDSAAPPATR